MKTNREIQFEAGQLVTLGRQFQNEKVGRTVASAVVVSRVLTALPISLANPGRERFIDATVYGGSLTFRLMERDADSFSMESNDLAEEPSLLVAAASAYDVLRTGYEIAEEERLTGALEPYAERSENRGEFADGEIVAEVESILGVHLLPPADRIRSKAEIVEFLEGRLTPSALIARNIERQCSREGYREHQVERHELKLTIGEP